MHTEGLMKQLLATTLALFLVPVFSLKAQETLTLKNPVDLRKVINTESIARDAYLWGYPLVRFERTKKLLTTSKGFGRAPINYFFHSSRPPTPRDREITNPLPDMLYSSAFLDLRDQPMTLQIPKVNRYFSLQFMDATTNNIAVVSTRTRGESPGKFFITGPRYIGSTPKGFEHIRSATNFVWVTGHIAAHTPDQAKSSYKLLQKYDLRPYNLFVTKSRMPKPRTLPAVAKGVANPRELARAGVLFYDELGTALALNEPANLEPAMMERFRSVDIGAGIMTSKFAGTREVRESYERAIASAEIDMEQNIRKNLITLRNSWNYIARKDISDKNYALRAALSKIYFGEVSVSESLHPVLHVDRSKVRLNGNENYVLHFDKEKMPQARAFWSVVTYNSRTKSLVENNLRRYSLGSYSKELAFNEDGSLDIYISANEPTGKTQNWLPAPRDNFYVMLNMYLPSEDAIRGAYAPPSVLKMSPSTKLSLNK